MMNAKTNKRALLGSALALLVCVTMLIGSTFAWFTDTATTGVNTIQAGTLKISLESSTDGGQTWADAEGKTLSFLNVDGESDILWEPGCTYNLPLIRVRNDGNLALKYELYINGVSGNAGLLSAIDFIANGTAISTFSGVLNEKDDASAPIQITGHMKESAGNEYQGLTLNGISITVVATQQTFEKDSIDDQYDATAEYPEVTVVSNTDDLKEALENGENVVLANDVIISESLPVTKDTVLDLNGKNIGTSGTTTGSPLYLQGGKLTVKNGTLDLDGLHTNVNGTFSTAIGYDAQTELVVENVNFTGKTAINGTFATDGPLKIAISDCTMDVTSVGIAVSANSTEAIATINNCNIDADEYAIFASQGSKITINGGTYKSAGKVITSMYDNTVVTINGGTFDGELWVTDGGSLVIYGGTFTADPSAYVAPGYQVTNNGNGTYTVGA